MRWANKTPAEAAKQRAVEDEVERARLIFTGSFKSIDMTTRDSEQLVRLKSVLSEVHTAGFPPKDCQTNMVLEDGTVMINMDQRLSKMQESQAKAMTNYFDFVGAADLSWNAHIWLADFHLYSQSKFF